MDQVTSTTTYLKLGSWFSWSWSSLPRSEVVDPPLVLLESLVLKSWLEFCREEGRLEDWEPVRLMLPDLLSWEAVEMSGGLFLLVFSSPSLLSLGWGESEGSQGKLRTRRGLPGQTGV